MIRPPLERSGTGRTGARGGRSGAGTGRRGQDEAVPSGPPDDADGTVRVLAPAGWQPSTGRRRTTVDTGPVAPFAPERLAPLQPLPLRGPRGDRHPAPFAPSRRRVRPIVVALALVLVLAVLAWPRRPAVGLDVEGVADGLVLQRGEVATAVLTARSSSAIEVRVAGQPIATEPVDGGIRLALDALADGEHRIEVRAAADGIRRGRSRSFAVTVDRTGPRLWVAPEVQRASAGQPTIVRGLADGTSTLTAAGREVAVVDGAFRVDLPEGTTTVELVAVDDRGRRDTRTVAVRDQPAPSAYPLTIGVHIGSPEWKDPARRTQILDLVRQGRVNAVQLDIKDERGEIGYASTVDLAVRSGAVKGHYDARAVIDELHGLGVRVIGRVVCFLDPILAQWADTNGRDDLLVLDSVTRSPLANEYGPAAFTNFASAEVQRYLIDLSREAAQLGFDEILFDYVRRPEGFMSAMEFPGLDGAPEPTVARFVRDARLALGPTATELGVSVFGVAATRPTEIGQDVRLLAPLVDYVAPMVYPSHWAAGEYGVADPVRNPGDIVRRSVADFVRQTAGSGAAVMPWLQDFSMRNVTYGTTEVRAQITATTSIGAPSFLLWNPTSEYRTDALARPASPLPRRAG